MMLDKPRLEDGKIVACLKADYGLTVTRLEFLPLGYDSNAGVYRVRADEQDYFLKVKSDPVSELSVLLPRYLREKGMEQVVAPFPTIIQDPWGKVDHFTLILYPFIEGKSGWDVGLSDSQWRAFGAVLKRLHATRLPPELWNQVPKETFVPHPGWMAIIRQLQATVGNLDYDNPFEQQLAEFWKDHHHEIGTIIDRAERLGRRLHSKSYECVLCHADIHTANLLVDGQGQFYIVDWDEPVLAPKERDLMFVTVGGFATEERTQRLFFEGYGQAEIDPLVMAYYRYERVMEDLAAFAERVFAADASDETKQDSVHWFMAQFAPGDMVEAAHRLDHVLS